MRLTTQIKAEKEVKAEKEKGEEDIGAKKEEDVKEDVREAKPGSVRDLVANVTLFMTCYLGLEVPSLQGGPKTSVMKMAAINGSPRFNKFSGIQEWRNGLCAPLCEL